MAEIIVYVDPDASGAGTGVDWANAYTSFVSAEAAEQTDLVSDGDNIIFHCRSSAGTSDDYIDINGWTTGASNTIKVIGEIPSTGIWSDSVYRLTNSSEKGFVLLTYEEHTTFEGIQATSSTSGCTALCGLAISDVANLFTVDRCIFKSTFTTENGININDTVVIAKIINTIVYKTVEANVTTEGIYSINSTSVDITNCVVYNFNDGIEQDVGTVTAINCLVFGNTDDFDSVSTIINCASDDGDGTNAVTISQTANDYEDLITNLTGGDFSPTDSSSELYNAGTNTNAPVGDIIGTSRPQATTTDIGAFEYVITSSSDSLTASSITATPVIATPEIGQTHALTASNISSTPVLSSPVIGQTHGLTATGITATPALGTPTASDVAGADNLTPDSIATTPVLSSPGLGQTHALNVSDVLSGTPVVNAPSIAQVHALSAESITSLPVISGPGIGQVHGLSASSIAATPVIASPDADESLPEGTLFTSGFTSGSPAVGISVSNPTIENYTGCDVSTPGSVVLTGAYGSAYGSTYFNAGNAEMKFQAGQNHRDIVCGIDIDPGASMFASYTDYSWSLLSSGVAGVAVQDPADFVDLQEVYTANTVFKIVYSGSDGTVKFYMDDVLKHTVSSVADSLAFAFDCELFGAAGDSIENITYIINQVTLGQIHVLSADNVLSTPLFTDPDLNWVQPAVLADRILTIASESRVLTIASESRILTV